MVAEIHADGQMKLTIDFRNFANAPKTPVFMFYLSLLLPSFPIIISDTYW
jgi:hypothetical protein